MEIVVAKRETLNKVAESISGICGVDMFDEKIIKKELKKVPRAKLIQMIVDDTLAARKAEQVLIEAMTNYHFHTGQQLLF